MGLKRYNSKIMKTCLHKIQADILLDVAEASLGVPLLLLTSFHEQDTVGFEKYFQITTAVLPKGVICEHLYTITCAQCIGDKLQINDVLRESLSSKQIYGSYRSSLFFFFFFSSSKLVLSTGSQRCR